MQRRRGREPRFERPLVQMLVLVANIQMKILKTEVEKGFTSTLFGRELLGPKVFRTGFRRRDSSRHRPKGQLVKIPIAGHSVERRRVSNLATVARTPGRVIFSF